MVFSIGIWQPLPNKITPAYKANPHPGIAIGEDIKNNVLHVDQFLNVLQFKRILKKHLYNYSLN